MARNFNQDPELILSLDNQYLSPTEREHIKKHTIDTKDGVCYGVNLKGKLGTICAGFKKAAEGYHFHLSGYPFYRITYTISGHAKINDGKEEYSLKAGSVYYFPPNASGVIINDSDSVWDHIYIHFTGYKAKEYFKKIASLSKRVMYVSKPGEIQNLFENIVNNCVDQSEYSQTFCDSYLKILLLKLAAQEFTNHNYQSPSRLSYIRCYNYIKENFSDISSLQDIAESCHINKVYLCRVFKNYAKVSPMTYVTNLKMNKAALLLMNTDYSIKQISFMLNYRNQYYFSRTFKKAYGISPSYYRESHYT